MLALRKLKQEEVGYKTTGKILDATVMYRN